jgi:hypothetical protein
VSPISKLPLSLGMMKSKIVLSLTLITCSIFGFSQTTEEISSLAQKTCDCLSGKTIDFKDKSAVQVALGLCLLDGIQSLNLQVELSDAGAMQELGRKVGVVMVGKCPKVFEVLVKDEMAKRSSDEANSVSGKVKAVDAKDYLTITLVEDSGKEHKILWIHYFEGSDQYVQDPRLLKGKNVTIDYTMKEVYMEKSKEYVTSKQAVKMVTH